MSDFAKGRCCYCPGALDSSPVSSPTETICIACQRLHGSPVEPKKDCECLDPRSRRRNLCRLRTDIQGEKEGHRCRSGVNEGHCLRCASSVVRWNSAKRTVQRLVWLIVPLLLLNFVSPSVAQVQESTSSHSTDPIGESKFTFIFFTFLQFQLLFRIAYYRDYSPSPFSPIPPPPFNLKDSPNT